MKALILSGQTPREPDDNRKDNITSEEASQLPIRFEEIESANSYCAPDGELSDAQMSLSRRDDAQLIAGDTSGAADTVTQIDQVVVDAETGKLVSVAAGGEMLTAEQFFSIYRLMGNRAKLSETELLLDRQQQQMEIWMDTLTRQMAAMMSSVYRMEAYLSQKLGLPITEENVFSAQSAEALKEDAPAMPEARPQSEEAQEQAPTQQDMPSASELGQEKEQEKEKPELRAEPLSALFPGSDAEQDEQQALLELPLLEKLDRIERMLDAAASGDAAREAANSAEAEDFTQPETADLTEPEDFTQPETADLTEPEAFAQPETADLPEPEDFIEPETLDLTEAGAFAEPGALHLTEVEEPAVEEEAVAEQEAALADAVSAEVGDENADLTERDEEEDTAESVAEMYSLKRPGAFYGDEEPIGKQLIESVIAELEAEDFAQPEDKADVEAVSEDDAAAAEEAGAEAESAAESAETAGVSAQNDTEKQRERTAQRNADRAASTFWENSGSQLLGMGLFVLVYCILTYFNIL